MMTAMLHLHQVSVLIFVPVNQNKMTFRRRLKEVGLTRQVKSCLLMKNLKLNSVKTNQLKQMKLTINSLLNGVVLV
jgi:hypothetical protein